MKKEDMEIYINKPVMLVLKDNKSFYGTYILKDDNTIIFKDRRRTEFPVDISFIGTIIPVDKIKYEGENHG